MAFEVYVPSDGLQGQNIPGHVLWADEPVDSIEVSASDEFADLEAFNVGSEGPTRNGNRWTFRRFERPGYLGFVLETTRSDSLDANAAVDLKISSGGKEFIYHKPIRLFRPSLSIDKPPTQIAIDTKGQTSDRIHLRHEGHGTLYVTVSTVEDSAIKTVIPEELLHAVKGFAEDFQKGLEALAPKYPDCPSIFEPFTKEELQDREAVGRRLSLALEEIGAHAELAGDMQELFTRSLLQNADFESLFFAPLLDFFSSIVAGGTILSMPWLEFNVPAGKSTLNLMIEAKDVLGVEIVKWKLPPIEIETPQETVLPLNQLVVWPKAPAEIRSRGKAPVKFSRARPSERRRGRR